MKEMKRFFFESIASVFYSKIGSAKSSAFNKSLLKSNPVDFEIEEPYLLQN
jgi:hypothetical protein